MTTARRTPVYLGNGWVLTANHTIGSDMTFNGQTVSEVPGTAFSLTNNGAVGKTATTDLKMFQINGIPTGVATLPIAVTTRTVGGVGQGLCYDNRDVLTAVFGNDSFMANLSYYRNQIVAVVPEHSAAMLAGMALAAGAEWATISRRVSR